MVEVVASGGGGGGGFIVVVFVDGCWLWMSPNDTEDGGATNCVFWAPLAFLEGSLLRLGCAAGLGCLGRGLSSLVPKKSSARSSAVWSLDCEHPMVEYCSIKLKNSRSNSPRWEIDFLTGEVHLGRRALLFLEVRQRLLRVSMLFALLAFGVEDQQVNRPTCTD